ncbi:hypothetical protein MLD38_012858 [Melastoma candidum]|uniref:Uncharacterized protein n=1 Tax=Melastoma candidum TaxID=119954 RepID=A0ACB9R7A8_9MYRT|nr:hypothetical protein MLD38_012858 [Melastoma candidum]
MSELIRPILRLWPRLPHRHSLPLLLFSPETTTNHSGTKFFTTPSRIYFRQRGLRFPDSPPPPDLDGTDEDDGGGGSGKSRNQKKREARRAVLWGMDLASFSGPQIKRVLRIVSLEEDVYEALMLVKKLGPDVREGKRRQFNYIGKLLREVEPELMDALIQTTKDNDPKRLQALSVADAWKKSDDSGNNDDIEDNTGENELEEEDSSAHASIADRWFNGLIDNDVEITSEVYSIRYIDFDRQELRKLVRLVQSSQERPSPPGGNVAALRARKSLTRLLCSLAKQSLEP